MDGDEYDCFLETGTYPSGYHKAQKGGNVRTMQSIAAYCTEKERGKMEFLRVPRGVEERERILHSCHSSKESEYDSSKKIPCH